MVITGDRTQVDLPRGVPSGLWDAERLLKTIPSMERKAKKIMTEPQNSGPEAAKNAFHRNHSSVFKVVITSSRGQAASPIATGPPSL